jgi:hypothetical protein
VRHGNCVSISCGFWPLVSPMQSWHCGSGPVKIGRLCGPSQGLSLPTQCAKHAYSTYHMRMCVCACSEQRPKVVPVFDGVVPCGHTESYCASPGRNMLMCVKQSVRMSGKGNGSAQRKAAPMALYQPQIPHDLTLARICSARRKIGSEAEL